MRAFGKMLSRVVLLFCVFSVLQSVPLPSVNKPNNIEPKVLIIGAGMGGLTVAKTLNDAGFTNFQIIEGSSRMGGRIMKTEVAGTTVELGAAYIMGKGINPVYKFTQDFGVSVVDNIPDTDVFRDTNGQDVTKEARKVIRKFYEARTLQDSDAKADRSQGNTDSTLAAALRYRDWNPVTELEDAVEAYIVDYEVGAGPTQISHQMMYTQNYVYDEHGDDTLIIVNEPRGLEYMVQSYADTFLSPDDERLVYNKVVSEIRDLGENGVKVRTDDGDVYTGDYVVSTVSVGVLQSGLIKHVPELPDWKRKAINKIRMAPFIHMYLHFPTQFWDDRSYICLVVEERGRNNMYLNMNHLTPGSNILQLSLWDQEAREVERLDDKEVVKSVVQTLRRAYPEADIPMTKNYAISQWTYDKLTMGGFPYYTPGLTDEEIADLQRRVGSLFFAGDYLDKNNHGYIHGTYQRSLIVAEELIACLNGECNEESDDGFQQFG